MSTVVTTGKAAAMRVRAPRSKRRTLPWVSIVILGGFLFVAAGAGFLTSFNPLAADLPSRLQAPAWAGGRGHFLLGSDPFGRDVMTRIFFGARVSLLVVGFVLVFGGGLGLAVGIVSGYVGGAVDAVLMRLTDCFMAIPSLLMALVFCVTIGPGLKTVIIALSVIFWSRFARIIRSEVLLLKERDFVRQAKVAGCSRVRIMLVHILPNVLNTFIVVCSLQVSHCIITEATLSFLGAGIPGPAPTWGNMVADGREFITSAWWISLFPGVALTLVVLSFNTFGDWLRDKLDPRLKQG